MALMHPSRPARFERPELWLACAGFAGALLLFLGLALPGTAAADIPPQRDWFQLKCKFDMPAGPLAGGFGIIEAPRPRAEESQGTQPVAGGTQSSWGPLPGFKVTIVPPNFDQVSGTPSGQLMATVDGDPGLADFVAVGGVGIDITIGDWRLVEFFFEFADGNGMLVAGPEQFPPDFGAATDSQCGILWENTETLEQEQLVSEVLLVDKGGSDTLTVNLERGNAFALAEVIELANEDPERPVVANLVGPDSDFNISAPLPVLEGILAIVGDATFRNDGEGFRFMSVRAGGCLELNNPTGKLALVTGFATDLEGGAIRVAGGAQLQVDGYTFSENRSDGRGGAIFGYQGSTIEVTNSAFYNNSAGLSGGAISTVAHFILNTDNSVFSLNSADEPDGASDIGTSGAELSTISGSVFGRVNIALPVIQSAGRATLLIGNDIYTDDPMGAALDLMDTDTALSGNTIREIPVPLDRQRQAVRQHAVDGNSPVMQPQASCAGSPGQNVVSLGFNISSDDACGLTEDTDLQNTDAMFGAPGENGIAAPLPGSPAIDHGSATLIEVGGVPTLPCGWRDLNGLGRPQDGDGDGGFECDAGAVEVQGAGAVQAGHSAAFFNSLRNGEGVYVEVLPGGRTVIYTFSYNPDGSGPAWFIGVGQAVGNSLVTQDMLRPEGAAWGDGFDTGAIDFADWGGMSIVFPACARGEAIGNMAYSGNAEAGFAPLLTRAERLTDVFGCGDDVQPHSNAGLSGSFFDPVRNGEGLVIQYLPDGRVLAIMFTYDPDGQQVWMFGVAEADDKTVTMEVVYPTGFTPWGAAFDADEVVLESWGTWTLTWSACDTLVFEYQSNIPGYGSGTRNYTRLTSLLGGECPAF